MAQVSGLLDAEAVQQALQGLGNVTHIFHCAYLTSVNDQHKDVVDNLAMLSNVIEGVEAGEHWRT